MPNCYTLGMGNSKLFILPSSEFSQSTWDIDRKQDWNHLLDLRQSCKHGHYYNCQIEYTFPGKSQFPESNTSGKSNFLESNISKENHISCGIEFTEISTFSGKSHFPGSHISWKIIFFKLTFSSEINIFQEIEISLGSHFPKIHILKEVTFSGNSHFPLKFNFSPDINISGKSQSHILKIHIHIFQLGIFTGNLYFHLEFTSSWKHTSSWKFTSSQNSYLLGSYIPRKFTLSNKINFLPEFSFYQEITFFLVGCKQTFGF